MSASDRLSDPQEWTRTTSTRTRATRRVPRDLAAIDDPKGPTKRVELGDRAHFAAGLELAEAYLPPWESVVSIPRATRPPRRARLYHKGKPATPYYVFQPEDRKTYNSPSYPWGCVCKITRPDGLMGSGVIIGPRHVLTASHVIQWDSDVAEKVEVHLVGNTARATTWTDLAFAYTRVGNVEHSTADEDYAVIVTRDRVGDRFGWFGAKEYNSSWDDKRLWATMGYASDVLAFSTNPTFQLNVALDEDEVDVGSARAMTTTADAMPGQSGSPMFWMWGGMPYVVAVVSAGDSDGDNICAGGADLNRVIRDARNKWP